MKMRTLLSILLIAGLATSAGCVQKKKAKVVRKAKVQAPEAPVQVQLRKWPAQPVIDIAVEQRQRNPDGSCVHCSWVTTLNHQRMYEMADDWFATYRRGESSSGLRRKASAEGIPFADTTSGDVAFVDWAIRTRRGCLVNDKPNHVRTLVGLDPAGTPGAKAWVLDNNGNAKKLHEYGREEWIRMWKRRGGWAAAPLYDPQPVVTHK